MSKIGLYKKQILEAIFRYIPKDDCVVFLFGSFSKDTIYPSSDIDIGIIRKTALENSVLVKIKEEVSRIRTLRDIDIVDFSDIPDKNFLKIALKGVKVWHQTKKSRVYFNNLKKQIKD